MALTIVAALVSIACVVASARRLVLVVRSTALDPAALVVALRGDAGRAAHAAIVAAIDRAPSGATWEHDVVEALRAEGTARAAAVNEQLTELDWRVQRWARVPRVCASIATSSAFLLASLSLRDALASDVVDVNAAVTSAINVASIGIAGAAFCIAIQFRARAVAKGKLAAADKLVERLEALASA